ncbi:SLAP domain-containing protein [uncultured Lactobacillus sp.]|uniref:SLAP domain-containing protein n=1 Tax=uncultured Lactobacillus sp. TaxID=153152 RepID=UPI0025FAFC9B|nr:SLAP domain-containing protein [uncultured Lactobacillus sp.]
MKKNLRIVSAAAAALLAVAPVAAGATSTVFADVTAGSNVDKGNSNVPEEKHITASVVVDNADGVRAGQTSSALVAHLESNSGTINSTGTTYKLYTAHDWNAYVTAPDGSKPTLNEVNTLEANTEYVVVANVFTINVKEKASQYFVNGVAQTSDNTGNLKVPQLASDPFSVGTTAREGVPEVLDANNNVVGSGAVGLGQGKYSVTSIADAIKAAYHLTTTGGHLNGASIRWNDNTLREDIKSALSNSANNIALDANGETFKKPLAPFTVTVHLVASNGNTATFPVTVYPDAINRDAALFPQMTVKINGQKVTYAGTNGNNVAGSIDGVYDNVALNSTIDTRTIAQAFTVTASLADSSVLYPSVDISKVNTKVAGRYPVTVSATNAAGNTTSVTFFITVGESGATYLTVQADIDAVPVYEITGNNVVTDTKTTVKNGDQLATFGTVTVNGKSYTRINSAKSTKFVETKYVDGSLKPAAAVAKKVMHNAYIYDKNHKRVGTSVLAAYSTVNVYGTTTKLADGSLVYKIGDNQYVMADNIDGTARVLSHNAYVYKTSKKRADRRVLKKGATVVTYGSPYTFKNGKAYYRIGGPKKQYVKVANFK